MYADQLCNDTIKFPRSWHLCGSVVWKQISDTGLNIATQEIIVFLAVHINKVFVYSLNLKTWDLDGNWSRYVYDHEAVKLFRCDLWLLRVHRRQKLPSIWIDGNPQTLNWGLHMCCAESWCLTPCLGWARQPDSKMKFIPYHCLATNNNVSAE